MCATVTWPGWVSGWRRHGWSAETLAVRNQPSWRRSLSRTWPPQTSHVTVRLTRLLFSQMLQRKPQKMSIFRVLRGIISCIIKHLNKSLSAPHQASWFKPDRTTVALSRSSASPARRPRHLHPKSPIASVLGHTHSHPQKGLVRTAWSASVKQQPQMTSACGFYNDVAVTTTAAAAMAT